MVGGRVVRISGESSSIGFDILTWFQCFFWMGRLKLFKYLF